LGEPSGFRQNARFAQAPEAVPPVPVDTDTPPDDPISRAYLDGFTAGLAAAEAEAEERARTETQARDALALSFARLDEDLQEEMRLRLRDTVATLCETAIAPLALDEAALKRRIEKAVSMLARADDERLIRLHPEDVALIAPQLGIEWQVVPDSTLERGSLRGQSV